MSIRIKLGHVYAWDPSKRDPENPLALVYVSSDPFELGDVDSAVPWLAHGYDWSARHGMLGVEMLGDTLAAYEEAVLDADSVWQEYVDEAMEFAEEVLDRLDEMDYGEAVDAPPTEDFRLVTFRSVEILQSYSGWLWSRRTSNELR